ncbi:recombinase family protein [Actinomadura rubrisoli]|uniref:Recombinase family protein n=1 Tax=Actinomadura rubrisoli TaxID=2530368 RepID=A0A4R5BF65_9ACTN|nr:recombinase family protein [Actinomadura rubrisoli]
MEGLIALNDLFQQGIGVKVLEGIALGEHTECSFILDLARALAEDRRRDIVRKTKNGLETARKQGKVGGPRRPRSTPGCTPTTTPARISPWTWPPRPGVPPARDDGRPGRPAGRSSTPGSWPRSCPPRSRTSYAPN